MVIGINKFKEFFKDYPESYIIIGGTACDLITEDAGFEPRATDDIDIVLIIEAIGEAFVKRFWEFIQEGEYQTKQKDTVKRNCYRFCDRKRMDFPKQIELFSKTPDILDLFPNAHLTPIPVGEGLSNLSAILLNEDYYIFTRQHSTFQDGIHFAKIEAIICLKAYAFLNNKARQEAGQKVRTQDIVKHKRDVFRMVFMLNPDDVFELPESIKADLKVFADSISEDLPDKKIFKELGAGNVDTKQVYNQLIDKFDLKNVIVIDHEIEMLKKKQIPKMVMIKKTTKIVFNVIQDVYFPLLKEANANLSAFNTLFKQEAWCFFEEPKPPKYESSISSISTNFQNMLSYLEQVAKTGDSHHQFKAIYRLSEYNDEADFSVEVSFKIWFYDYDYSIDIFIGKPYQSSEIAQGLLKLAETFSKKFKTEKHTFSNYSDYRLPKKKYNETVSNREITLWMNDLNKNLLQVIKQMATDKTK